MVAVKSVVWSASGRRLGEVRTMKLAPDHFVMTVVLTEDCPDGPDVVSFNYWNASMARTCHLGTARAIAGRDGKVVTDVPGLLEEP